MAKVTIAPQPTDETCGPTSLHAIYQYYGYDISLEKVIETVERSVSGGTLAPLLGVHALKHGFDVTIYTNNLNIFDLTWFSLEAFPPADYLIKKLRAQHPYLQSEPGLLQTAEAYELFLSAGGVVRFQVLTTAILKHYLQHHQPIITGLSSTYLYGSMRERFTDEGESISDDIQGTPCGHFVVLAEYDTKKRQVMVADPYRKNPISGTNYYQVSINQVLNAILLGVFTYDANLLIITPKNAAEA